MKLNELYIPYESKVVDNIFNKILESFKASKRAPYIDKNLEPKEGEFLELISINYPSKYINVQRRFNNPDKWQITFKDLENAVKFTLRMGGIQGSGDYNKMTGTSNFIGTPLHILIALIPNKEYLKASIVGKSLHHKKFGAVKVNKINMLKETIFIETEGAIKEIAVNFFELIDEEFNRVINEQST